MRRTFQFEKNLLSKKIETMTQIHKVGPFLIGNKLLGEGATGKVFLSFHEESNVKVAIKIIDKASICSRPEKKRKVERELAILRIIHHPNIIDYYASYETTKLLFVVQELLSGGELFTYVEKKKKLSLEESVKFLLQILSALKYIHKWQICHRDVKLENILLSHDCSTAKLCDFGMATYTGGMPLRDSCGSPFYAAPELFTQPTYDGCIADIWSLGVVFYVMIFGLMPFPGETDEEFVENVTKLTYQIPFELPPPIHEALTGMLCGDVKQRLTLDRVKALIEPFSQITTPARPIPSKKINYSIFDSLQDLSISINDTVVRNIPNSLENEGIIGNEPNKIEDVETIAGGPITIVDTKVMQMLSSLLTPLHISKIREALFAPNPNTVRAFYRSITEHTQNSLKTLTSSNLKIKTINTNTTLFAVSPLLSDPSSYKKSVSPAFCELLKKKRSCSPVNIKYKETVSPPSSVNIPHEINVFFSPTEGPFIHQATIDMTPSKTITKINEILKELGIVFEHQITVDNIEKCLYHYDIDDSLNKNKATFSQIIFTILISVGDTSDIDVSFEDKTIIKFELSEGSVLVFGDLWNVIKRQLLEYDSFPIE
ncbi:serine/threonine protein kinase, putative [Entamoeba nuttalli P19]|uniref:non-specific serine/threonine protein kinase n=2 Tax=Entamoeba nuttalli TaxID=412467 RepID=K2GSR4_ENTNP|nr:serine/threonine protein kinase, putative [Entamoeba nuttalli P19]EKE38038.1 serine/threonine protein kinase, putative [Entamoeba nuttalli P19]|eukprot:XP_008859643.1 serine/threonine protein kinase, putative [Entamoeba nuttalli P19]